MQVQNVSTEPSQDVCELFRRRPVEVGRVFQNLERDVSEPQEIRHIRWRRSLKAKDAAPTLPAELQRQLTSECLGATDAHRLNSED
jgi:hypothetical protein